MAYLLLVDDDNPLRTVLKAELETEGFIVSDAENGLEGLKLAKANPPDLIISDIMMPVMDGFTFQENLSEDPDLKLIPLIFLSVLADKDRLNKAKLLGAEDYIIKPFEMEDLLIAINAKLKKAADRQSVLNLRLDEIRKSILYSLPHEFRNPLSTLNGFISLLLDKDFEKTKDEEEEFLTYVRSSGDRLNNLVTNFMKLAELEIIATNREQVKKIRMNRNFNWGLIFNNFLNDFKLKFGLEIKSGYSGEEFPIAFDLEALQNVMNELLINAKNFTRTEPKEISITAKADSKGLELKVKDNGMGMETDAISRITETFYQHNRVKMEQQGGGLGLTIVSKIISIYGGKLMINSEVGKGTEVVVFVPLY